MSTGTDFVEALIESVHRDPGAVLSESDRLISSIGSSSPDLPGLQWARGLARRELGDLDGARSDLEHAIELARGLDDSVLAARVAVSSAAVEMALGDLDRSRELLASAEPSLEGGDLGRLIMQRGLLDHRAGDLERAVVSYESALGLLTEAGDLLAGARLRLNLGLLLTQGGQPVDGHVHLSEARRLAVELGQSLLAAMAAHNLGFVAASLGRTSESLELYDEAERAYEALGDGLHVAVVGVDRAAVLVQAGLHDEAMNEASRVRTTVETSRNVLEIGETELIGARSALAAGWRERAVDSAGLARRSFIDADRAGWAVLAEGVELLARLPVMDARSIATAAGSTAERLDEWRWSTESTHVRVAAALELLRAGRPSEARRVLDPIEAPRPQAPVVDAIAGWTAKALRSRIDGDLRSARRAVTSGLRILASNDVVLEAPDLRAHAVEQATVLAEIGARIAIDSGRAREFLRRLEALRNATVVNRGGTPTAEVGAALAALRALEAERRSTPDVDEADVDRRRAEVESTIRSIRWRQTGGDIRRIAFDESVRSLGERSFIGFELVDEEIAAVSIVGGRASLHEGARSDVDQASDIVSFSLQRLARSHLSEASAAAAQESLGAAGAVIEAALLPPRVLSRREPLVIAPGALLHGVPWSVLPGLRHRPHSVVPSLGAWMLAEQTARFDGPTLMVAGPDLEHADDEIELLSTADPGPTIPLTSGRSSASSVIGALSEAAIAHFACHGEFRGDNPLFSSLMLADGSLSIYDLEECRRLPHTIVLSACSVGQSVGKRGGALLGLAASLLQLGVGSVIAPLSPVNDQRSIALMDRLHAHLRSGDVPSVALQRASIRPDGSLDPTASPFVCFGR